MLWTGGWDSTFRLLDLVLVYGATVQPWYILDEERQSTGYEVDAMLRIRTALAAQDPAVAERVLPTHYRERTALPADAETSERFGQLNTQDYLGSQYEWLARFALGEDINEIALSVHREDKAYAFLDSCVEPVTRPWGQTYKLVPCVDNPNIELFRPFSFPLLDWTKIEMQEYAAEHGFDHLMQLTWFCHSPRDGQPCGLCGPCGYTIGEGFAHRVPRKRRLRRLLVEVKRAAEERLG